MSFTEEDYIILSYENKLKKILFAIKQYLEDKKDYEYIRFLIELFNKYEKTKLNLPENKVDFKILYEKIYTILRKENPFLPDLIFDDITKERKIFPIKIILENLRSPFNVGSIIRSAEAFGVEEIIVTGFTPTPEHPKVQKVAMNSCIKWSYYKNVLEAISTLKEKGYKIYSIEKTKSSKRINNNLITLPVAFIFGNEEFGISKETLSLSDDIFYIEMFGQKNSLNVAVATSIVLYETTKMMIEK